jgi:hypothetical protein
VVDTLGLDEVVVEDDAYMVLRSEMMPEPVGSVRVYHREGSVTMVYVGMTVAPISLDSHMMFAFTPPESAVPHFTVDSVQNADSFAFHLDLIPRVDLGAHLAYMDHCFTPLTEVRDRGMALDGLSPAHLAPRQWALMSEWMMAHRADEGAFRGIGETVDAYRDHWFALMADGVPADVLGGVGADDLRSRDAANRAAIFDPDVDKVWANVERLIGTERSEQVRTLLAGAGTAAVAS